MGYIDFILIVISIILLRVAEKTDGIKSKITITLIAMFILFMSAWISISQIVKVL